MITLRLRAVAVLALVSLGAFAHAPAASATPSAWSAADVTLLSGQQPVLLVSGTLPDSVPLPYQGELAVPAGSAFLWMGEIVGTDPSKDPTLQYTKRTEGDLDIYSFTLTQSRTAQLEVTPSGMSTSDGTNVTTQLRWKAWVDIPSVRIAERVIAGSQVVQGAEGATLQPNDAQYAYYAKTVKNVKAGDMVELVFTYKPGTPVASGSVATGAATGKQSLNGVLVPIVAVLLIGTVVGFVRINRSGSAQAVEPTVVAEPQPKPKPRPNAARALPRQSDDEAFFDEDEL